MRECRYGPVTGHWGWRIKNKQDLRGIHKTSNLVANTNMKGLKWPRNVITMEPTYVANNIFERKPESKKTHTEMARSCRE